MRLFPGRMAHFGAIGGVLLGALVLVGCGQSRPTGKLTGQVLYKGNPVSDAEVHFFMKERGIGTKAEVDDAGNFSVPVAGDRNLCRSRHPAFAEGSRHGGQGQKDVSHPGQGSETRNEWAFRDRHGRPERGETGTCETEWALGCQHGRPSVDGAAGSGDPRQGAEAKNFSIP